MEPEESKISVWVCREEKVVSGLSKRTTCADVIKVLLEEQSSSACPRSYCIVEKWRGSERVLPHKTKILRLWSAWGDEQENVRFVLVRSEASLAGSAPRSAEARVVLSRDSPRVCRASARASAASTGSSCPTASVATAATALTRERQRRIVRKAFRKLERMNRRRARAVAKDARSAERMETLVHVVVSQDHTIRQQIRRLEELDAEIDRHEARVHLDRVKAHGANYVQDTYLVGAEQDGGREERGGVTARPEGVVLALRLEEYADKCEEVVRLHEELAEREALAASLMSQIEEELNRRWMERRREEPSGAEDSLLEEEQVRTELDTSLYIGLRLSTDLEAVRNELDLTHEIWEARDKELRDLLEKVDSLELEEEEDEEEDEEEACARMKDVDGTDTEGPSAQSPSGWVEQARGLSKTCNSNDDDSDTGLSSMHSQDSDSAPVCESLV
ncbi:ras association domain-containing protein 10 [Colossoma macropomum]|uniref:ras association domain-containing protein 10 n=1 Tax=Colossoma macropomum TaxID=42526 RepID=UPI0018650B31|nr:ras association domain-containing protein 10 [Colossoma macropomum]